MFPVKLGYKFQNIFKRMPKTAEFTDEKKEGSRKKLRRQSPVVTGLKIANKNILFKVRGTSRFIYIPCI